MDFYLEPLFMKPSSSLTFDLVVIDAAGLLKWSLWFPYIHVKTYLAILLYSK